MHALANCYTGSLKTPAEPARFSGLPAMFVPSRSIGPWKALPIKSLFAAFELQLWRLLHV